MNFGEIKHILIMGGGQRMVNFINVARKEGFNDFFVLTSDRHLERVLENEIKLRTLLDAMQVPFVSCNCLRSELLSKYLTPKTLGISFGAPWTFNPEVIGMFEGRLINAHSMNLPRNRGAGGFSWQILCANRSGGLLFHIINKNIDQGPIVMMETFEYPLSCKIPKDYEQYLSDKELLFFKEFLVRLLRRDSFCLIEQDERKSTYFPRLATQFHGYINWEWKAEETYRFICAFDYPYSGAQTFWKDKLIHLRDVEVCDQDGPFHPFISGLIYRKNQSEIFIACCDQSISLKSITDSQGQDLTQQIKVGDRLVTPVKYLEEAKAFKAVYLPEGFSYKV